ncbi:endonuclease-reverse transcriptase [Plakobranchus ocellatus]|uniref:Endonuclease-reverse transcriptase n=1 Tax=Plakobranchus ocellatus TaxID=259542 RepID=A0AAV3ZTX1_9GAST|nr:endonuclease-reverse transcriptase [Plakobranchus ocellatus]
MDEGWSCQNIFGTGLPLAVSGRGCNNSTMAEITRPVWILPSQKEIATYWKHVDLNIIQVYAPTANSNGEDLDKFYNELDTAKTQCKSQDPLIIMGDFNAKVGTEKVDDIAGNHGLGIRNERGATECELHRTISLMSHITKILLKIIMLRIRNILKPEIEEQCGFVEDKGTSNAIYILRTLIERALEVQKDVYLCFIDYTKAFDRVRHDEIITELKQLNIDGKDLRIIKTMYWE